MTVSVTPEFSYIVSLSAIGGRREAARFDLTATDKQRSALSARFGCIDIPRFEIEATVAPLRKDGHFRVKGFVRARVIQHCVVSLEPVTTDLEKAFELLLLPESDGADAAYNLDEEDIETYSGNSIDLGEIGAIELALALDPYPRATGVTIEDLGPGGSDQGYEVSEEGQLGRNRPFEALATLKRKV